MADKAKVCDRCGKASEVDEDGQRLNSVWLCDDGKWLHSSCELEIMWEKALAEHGTLR